MNSTSLVGRYNILNNKWGVFYTPNGCRISVYTRVSGGNGSGIAGTSFGEVSQEVFEMIDDVACWLRMVGRDLKPFIAAEKVYMTYSCANENCLHAALQWLAFTACFSGMLKAEWKRNNTCERKDYIRWKENYIWMHESPLFHIGIRFDITGFAQGVSICKSKTPLYRKLFIACEKYISVQRCFILN